MKTKGFTLLEVLIVLAILSVVTLITLPLINKTRENAQIEQLKSEMITRVLDLQDYFLEKEAIDENYIIVGAQFYNSPYYNNSVDFENTIKNVFADFPLYLAAEIECNEDSTGKFLKISISYPGYSDSSDTVTRLKDINERDLAQRYLGVNNSVAVFNDISGCSWEAYNNKQLDLPNGNTIIISKVSITSKIYDLSEKNNHVKVTTHHLVDLQR